MARILSEKSESSLAPNHSFCGCTVIWRGAGFRRGVASNLYALGADDKVVQRILRHAKPHVTKERYIKVFDPAVLEAMRRMQATLEELRRGQQKTSSFLSIDGKLLKPNAGEVAERLKAAVC
jgi:hypothetical protein